MGCAGSKNEVTELKDGEYGPDGGPTKTTDQDFDGPLAKRSCTDIFMLFVFIAFYAGVGFIAYQGYMTGDPYKILYGLDSWGNTCNRNNSPIENASYSGRDMSDMEYRFYWDPAALTNPLDDSIVSCVSACPENNTIFNQGQLNDFHRESGANLCRPDVDPEDVGASPNNACPSFIPPIPKTLPMLSFCVPEAALDLGESMMDNVAGQVEAIANNIGVLHAQCTNSQSFVHNVLHDIERSWMKILYLCAGSVGVAFIFTLLLRFMAAFVIWLSVILCALGSLAGAGFCWYTWYEYYTLLNAIAVEDQMAAEQTKVDQWLYIGIAASVVAGIILLVLLVMRKKIALVVQLFQEAGKVVAKMPLLLLQPLWTMIAIIFFIGGLLAVYSYVHTAGIPVVNDDGTVVFQEEEMMFYMKWYYLLGMLWIAEFIFACQQLVVAGAVAKWFFTRDKSKLGCAIANSTKRLVAYHLGSVAFGSLIVALIQFVRIILGYIQNKLQGKTTKAVDYLLKILQCCLWCFEKIIKFINKNAYIMIAIYGTNFCRSAQKALVVIVGNALMIGAINSIGTFCLFLSKLGVSAIVTAIGLYFFKDDAELCYMFVPLICSGLFAFAIAHCFLNIYSMTIDTIFMCFCEDCSRNDGINSPYFMSKDLMKYVENSDEAMSALEAREKSGER